ncbi:PRA1 family protein Jwa isoform 2-T2 [Cochliomyia hominivorax]
MSVDVAEAVHNLAFPPLRTLNDFILGSARFQLPNLQDYDKWGNRVVKNLLYYQTNYFLIFLSIYTLMIILNPLKVLCGVLVQAMIIAIILHSFGGKQKLVGVKLRNISNPNQRWYFLAGSLLIGYMLLHWLDAILLSSFTLLLPFSKDVYKILCVVSCKNTKIIFDLVLLFGFFKLSLTIVTYSGKLYFNNILFRKLAYINTLMDISNQIW